MPQGFVAAISAPTDDPIILTLLMIGILIAAVCVMETTPNIVILAPILKPLADSIPDDIEQGGDEAPLRYAAKFDKTLKALTPGLDNSSNTRIWTKCARRVKV